MGRGDAPVRVVVDGREGLCVHAILVIAFLVIVMNIVLEPSHAVPERVGVAMNPDRTSRTPREIPHLDAPPLAQESTLPEQTSAILAFSDFRPKAFDRFGMVPGFSTPQYWPVCT